MFNWLRKKLGYHVCEEFTQWRKFTANYKRPVMIGDGTAWVNGERRIMFTKSWQERKCTMCGRIFQEDLEHVGDAGDEI